MLKPENVVMAILSLDARLLRRVVSEALDKARREEESWERRALRDLCELSTVIQPEGDTRQYIVAPVTSSILDALAAFEADREDLEDGGDQERVNEDGDILDAPHE